MVAGWGWGCVNVFVHLGLEATMTAFAQFSANMTDKVSHVKCFKDASWMT